MIGELHQRWLESRGIDPEVAVRFGLYTDRNALAFPFIEDGKEVACKYRGPNKTFWQRAGGKRVFWNVDVLSDPALSAGDAALVITEGELDALSAIQSGFPFTVSVPDGAPSEPTPVDAGPDADAHGKFSFVHDQAKSLKRVKRFILAVDNDAPGQILAAEFERRFGAVRCSFVTYPEGCKDLNDVLKVHGPDGVKAVLDGAKPYPTKGIYQLSDYPPKQPIRPLKTGWPTLDPHLGMFPGCFEVVTGIPGHGKTTWTLNRAINVGKLHGWRTAIFSPEMPTVPHMHNKMRRIYAGAPLEWIMANARDLRDADRFLNEHFLFIDSDPEDGQDEDHTLGWVIERAHDAVHKFGIQHLIIDPWNEVEHARPAHESMPDYIGRGIRMLKRLAKERQLHVTVIVHPTKAVGGDDPRMPNLYDCEGSAHWYNKPDLGVVVGRDPENEGQTIIRVAKVRFDETGSRGDVRLRYRPDSCRFEMLADYQMQAAE